MTKSLICLSAGVVLLPAANLSAAKTKTTTTPDKPNILVILADDLGWGDLSCQWAKDVRTPNIDALFTGGVRLDRFYAASDVSSPSRAGLLTGCYPIMVGVPGVIRGGNYTFGYLSKDAILLPVTLKPAGYKTAIVGKWHLGLKSPNLPNDRGFDYFAGFLGDMMNSYYTYVREGQNYMRINYDPVTPSGHATEVFTNWAIDYLNKAKTEKEPFFLYLAYNAPHDPLQPPKEFEDAIRKREPGITETRSKYLGLIEHMDQQIGRVMSALEKNGQLENTLIVFTSDNGGREKSEANNGPVRGFKADVYEGGIRVPCALYWKGVLKPVRLENTVHMCDLYPTFCQLAGAKIDHHVDGMSVWPLIEGKPLDTNNRYLFWMQRKESSADIQAAARYADQKLLRPKPKAAFEYYDLKADPKEATDLGTKGAMYDDLVRRLNELITQGNRIPWREGMVIEND